MDLIWIEDFLALAVTQNFSKAAALRNVTQPAFSRRIQRLEIWAGAPLLDRRTTPVRLTPEGVKFRTVAAEALTAIRTLRDEFRLEQTDGSTVIRFAALHTLALALYPGWIQTLERRIGATRSSLVAANLDECLAALCSGDCDFLLSYVDPDPQRLAMDAAFLSIHIGEDRLLPITGVQDGRPIHVLDGDKTIAYLRYAPESLLGRLTQNAINQAKRTTSLDTRYENTMSEALKAMALKGAGVAWLPLASVRNELAAATLARAGGDAWALKLEIRIYRRRGQLSKAAERLWRSLEMA